MMLFSQLCILLLFISEFTADTCNFDVKLHQELFNQGFHRNLTYKITLGDKYGDSHKYEECLIAVDQILPAGVYANPDELRELMRMNKISAVPKNRVNIELPAELSQPTSVLVLGAIWGGEVTLWLPVHARYHQAAQGGGYFRNEIESPLIYITCPHIRVERCKPTSSLTSFPCKTSKTELCTWKQIPFTALSETVTFPVPIGNTSHYQVVAPVTLGAIIVFSLYLLKTLHEYKLGQVKKRP